MLPFNAYTLHELLGLVVMAPLSVMFYVGYFALGRRRIDLLFANWLGFLAAFCFSLFMQDNIIRQGEDPTAFPGAAILTLHWFRVNFAVGVASSVTQIHFVLCYRGLRCAQSRGCLLLYGLGALVIPFLWTDWVFAARTVPAPGPAGWLNALPWMPVVSPLTCVYPAIIAGCTIASLVIVFRKHPNMAPGSASGSLSQIGLVRAALLVVAAGAFLDVILGILDWTGCAMAPFAFMVMAVLVSWSLVHERLEAERNQQRMEEELRIAGEIQRGLLPTVSPDVSGFSLAGWSRAAESAGGDTYDFLQLPGGQWMVSLADASGHGMGPALLADETRAMLRALSVRSRDAADILRELRTLLALDLPKGHFVTCFLGLLDPASATLSYASAGQGPILFYDTASDRLQQEAATDVPLMPLGILRLMDVGQTLRQHKFETGTFLAVVSDGLYEAANASGQQFGIPRLAQALYRHRHLPAGEMITNVWHEVDAFRAGADQRDDMTMVVLKKD